MKNDASGPSDPPEKAEVGKSAPRRDASPRHPSFGSLADRFPVEPTAHHDAVSPCCGKLLVLDPTLQWDLVGICPSCCAVLGLVGETWGPAQAGRPRR